MNLSKRNIIICVVSLLFVGLCIERVKNNSSYFVTFFQNDKLESFELELKDFVSGDISSGDISIIDSKTFKSNTSDPYLIFYKKNNAGHNRLRSILIDVEFSTERALVSINATNQDGIFQKEVGLSLVNDLSHPFEENKTSYYIDHGWDIIKRVTESDISEMPRVVTCKYDGYSSLVLVFYSDPEMVVKINKIVINPRLNIFFNFRIKEYISISFLIVFIFFFIFVLPLKDKKVICEYESDVDYLKKAENIFCVCGFIFGMLFVFLIPPFQSPDEPYHFERSYILSTLQFFPHENENGEVGYNYPRECIDIQALNKYWDFNGYRYIEYLKYKNIKISGEEIFKPFYHAMGAAFSILYLPQSLGMFIYMKFERLFFMQSANVLDIFYAGRIFNLLFYLIIGYFSIKTIPFFKYVIASVLLLPMSIAQAASLNYDSFVIGVTIYLICLLLKIYTDKKNMISKKDAYILAVMAPILVNVKVYFVIFLILFFIRKKKFSLLFNKVKSNKIKKGLYIFIVFSVSAISFFLWNIVLSSIYRNIEGLFVIENVGIGGAISIKSLLSVRLDSDYYKTLLYNFFENRSYYLEGIIGIFAWTDTFFPGIFITISILFISILSIFDANKEINIHSKDKIIFIVVYILCSIIIATILYYMTGTSYDGRIVGIQGRYFIPVLPLLLIFFYTRLPLSYKLLRGINVSINKMTMCFICFSLLMSMMLLMFRFYA
jgi:uncharacterized membrane protein